MTPDAFSDLVLAVTCFWCVRRASARGDGGIVIACLLIGLAATIGVLRFSSWETVAGAVGGAHRFAALVAASMTGVGSTQKVSSAIVATASTARSASGAGSNPGAGSSKYMILTTRR